MFPPPSGLRKRQSELLSGFSVIFQPKQSTAVTFVVSNSTNRITGNPDFCLPTRALHTACKKGPLVQYGHPELRRQWQSEKIARGFSGGIFTL